MSYFKDIQNGVRTTLKGLSLTLRHLRQATHPRTPEGIASDNYFDQQNGLVTLQYPHEQLPIPDNGRYRLRNEIEDCIVCDKCAKICPVDCITIDAIKATEEVGRASDGSPIRLYAAKFDIDMAKCCYCGLCTVVCPTECLTMDKKFDYSEFELGKLTYSFAELTPAEADEKRALYEQFVREKEEAKVAQAVAKASDELAAAPVTKRPVFRPTAKPAAEASDAPKTDILGTDRPSTDATPTPEPTSQPKRPVFRPTQKPNAARPDAQFPAETRLNATELKSVDASADQPEPVADSAVDTEPNSAAVQPETPKARSNATPTVFRPSMKPAGPMPGVANSEDKEARKPVTEQNSAGSALAHPLTDATPDEMQRIAEDGRESVGLSDGPLVPEPTPESKPKPAGKPAAFRPTMKPKPAASAEPPSDELPTEPKPDDAPKPKPAFRPTMKSTGTGGPASPPKSESGDAESA